MNYKELLTEYYKLFPNDGLFPDWDDINIEDRIIMLKEAIQDKKDISKTKLFENKYMEQIITKEKGV